MIFLGLGVIRIWSNQFHGERHGEEEGMHSVPTLLGQKIYSRRLFYVPSNLGVL